MSLHKVNLLQGTNSYRQYSRGNTLPLVARPFGMHHWTLQTNQSPWTFASGHMTLQGIRLTHQPSPWMRDYGNVLVTAFHGDCQGTMEHQASAYRLDQAELTPYRMKTELLRYNITMEMAPTERGGVFAFTRRHDQPIRVRFHFDKEHTISWDESVGTVTGVSHNNTGGVAEPFGLHFVAEFSAAPTGFDLVANGGYFTFPAEVEQLEMRIAASFISPEIAQISFQRELRGKSLSQIVDDGEACWSELMSRVRITTESEEQARTFYSCLYRCLLFPRFLDEIDAEGRTVHYNPYTGGVAEGTLCTDNGFWDTFRTVYPLFALLYPDKLRLILNGWLAACRESNWSPKWPSPGGRDCMIGTHFDVVVADAIAKGITDWDIEEVYRYLWKDATIESADGCYGRQGLEAYRELGYVPTDRYAYAASSTLDYSYDDFCIAQVARYLGREEEAKSLLKRSQSYRNIYDPGVGFMRGRMADGSWEAPFREFAWGGSFIEGGPWQHLFNVPHDPNGLIELLGGPEATCAKLDTMLATPPYFDSSHYGFEIHEMTEMAAADFGQYAQSNQPVHNFLFLYALAGQPGKTSHWVQRVTSELYSPDFFPGDEDNGEMSAWYIFATLGLYPFCPGTPEYVTFEPSILSAELTIPGRGEPLLLGKLHDTISSAETTISHEALLKRGISETLAASPALA